MCCRNTLIEDKRRLEQRIVAIEDDLEEEQSNLEMMVDKARKNGQQVGDTRPCHS